MQNKQDGITLWFTGLSGSGKTTLANLCKQELQNKGYHAYVLDGDTIREGLNKDLGFSPADRTENIRRIGEVANILRDCGIINIVAFISPYRADRQVARNIAKTNENFIEVFIDCPLPICERRDPKGMYKKARDGTIKEFTGISAPYEPPVNPEIHLHTDTMSTSKCISIVMHYLSSKGVINE